MLTVTLRAGLALIVASLAACSSVDEISLAEDRRAGRSEVLELALAEGAPADRVRAARAMGRIQSPGYVRSLTAAASGTADRQTRLAALFALGQLGLVQRSESTSDSLARVIAQESLKDEDAEIVAAAVQAVGKLGKLDMAEPLTKSLAHRSAEVRREAALALFRLRFAPLWRGAFEAPPELPDFAVQALVGNLDDADDDVRWSTAYAFSRYGEPRAVPALAERLGDPVEWVRLFAVRSIGNSGIDAAAEQLVEALVDSSALVRTEAVLALDRLERPDLLPASVHGDPSLHVRAALAAALGRSADAASVETLRGLEQDDAPTVRSAAISALARRLGPDYREAVERHLKDARWPVRSAAARAAGSLGTAALDLARLALEDDDHRVRIAALEGAATVEGMGPHILDALRSPDLALRGSAIALLAEGDFPGKSARLREVYDASPGLEWIEVRELIVDTAAGLDEPGGLLWQIARVDPVSSVRSRAVNALKRLDKPLPRFTGETSETQTGVGVRRFRTDPIVVLETSKGEIEIRCLAREAPRHVSNFVELVSRGFYDGLIWHRVVPNFVIQGGDPRGDGWGGPGYHLRDEIHPVPYRRGTVGMPKAGKDTGGCQLFITHVPTPHLDGNYTVFGEVVAGMEVVDRIEVGDLIRRARLR